MIILWAEPEGMPDHERTPPLARIMDVVRMELGGMPDPDIERALGLYSGMLAEIYAGYVPPIDQLMRLTRRIHHATGAQVLDAERIMLNISTGRQR